MASAPGEQFEPRQTTMSDDYTPDPLLSLPLDAERQAVVDDIIDLYSCDPTVEKVKRYTPDCVYDDQFVYANDRYKVAGYWFALPKLFKESKNVESQIIASGKDFIQFKNMQTRTFRLIPKKITTTSLVTLSLDPSTVNSDFIQVKYHKDQSNAEDFSHEGVVFKFKQWQADHISDWLSRETLPEMKEFEADRTAAKEDVHKHGSGKYAPTKDVKSASTL
ncbi:hypothetical protein P152DRAFT_506491 [Eremomyces bilateralis CBS 781.70]|uniref:Uncharacterized protein n=1 Tax=Eremomyces bilateralis CBS 781.70 TaxID=1392243 RepID=A0A6G1G6S6_9PEZI|nr:uncharacterized protein P152DRAFT_506491 [Eremomyces bilateralis CBS 781.70]KAF1813590.1 hypothetical protein P152DRAFT_506491 [Eremomyces bilateralis CBS 781.70]